MSGGTENTERCPQCNRFMRKAFVTLEHDGAILAKGTHHVGWYCEVCGVLMP